MAFKEGNASLRYIAIVVFALGNRDRPLVASATRATLAVLGAGAQRGDSLTGEECSSFLTPQGDCASANQKCYRDCRAQLTTGRCYYGTKVWHLYSGIGQLERGRCFVPTEWSCSKTSECRPGSICVTADADSDDSAQATCQACPQGAAQPVRCAALAVQEASDRWAITHHQGDGALAIAKKAFGRWVKESAKTAPLEAWLASQGYFKTADDAALACKDGSVDFTAAVMQPPVSAFAGVAKDPSVETLRYLGGGSAESLAVEASIQYLEEGLVPVTEGFLNLVSHAVDSLKGGIQAKGKGSSRSGASFFMSSDGLFFLKGFERRSEYDELVAFLDRPHLISLLGRDGLGGTVLNIPWLAFPAFSSAYWVVMPNADRLFRLQMGQEPIAPPKMWDVKPYPLISKDRISFLQHLSQSGFALEGTGEAPFFGARGGDPRAQAFFAALEEDLKLMRKRNLVDFSWLIYEYKMSPGFELPPLKKPNLAALVQDSAHAESVTSTLLSASSGPWCFPSINQKEGEPVLIMCFTLIDYTLFFRGEFVKSVENDIMSGKWDSYPYKFSSFTRCLFRLSPTHTDITAQMYLRKYSVRPMPSAKYLSKGYQTVLDVYVENNANIKESATDCNYPERRAACFGEVTGVNITILGGRRAGHCQYGLTAPPGPHVDAWVNTCLSWAVIHCHG